MRGKSWELTDHVRSVLSEALVAEAIYQRHTDAKICPPRHRGYDVWSADGDMRVDAKTASILAAKVDGGSSVTAVEWDAGGRADILHESATHLGLAVLDTSLTALRLFAGTDTALRGEVVAHGRVFLVPKEVAIEEARPIWSTRHDRPSRGRFRYLRLVNIEQYEIEFQTGLTSKM